MKNDAILNAKIRSLKLSNDQEKISLKGIFVSLNIYEDLFSPFITGKIVLEDTNDLISRFPIVGGEDLEISFNSQNDKNPKIHNYKIYKLDSDSLLNKSETNYNIIVLYFCSPEMIINENTSINRKFLEDTSGLLQKMLNKIFFTNKDLVVDHVDNQIEFIANFWTPIKVIKYLEECSKNTFKDFVFFENLDGFNFRSVSEMMTQNSTHKLYYKDISESMHSLDIIKISKMNSYFNEIELARMGYFGNKVYHLEDDYYGFKFQTNDFITATEKSTSLGKNVQHRDDLKNNNNIFLTYKSCEQLSYRDIILKTLAKYNMVIKVNGDSTKKVGQVFDLIIKQNMKDNNQINKMVTGKWFCTNINHEISRSGKYEQNIKIVKNAFFDYKTYEDISGRKNL